MRFDADRLAKLAGIDTRSSDLMTEAGNRSKHDESDVLYKGYDYYDGDLNEADDVTDEEFEETFNAFHEDVGDDDDDDIVEGDDWDGDEAHDPELEEDEEILDINEADLRREILKMRSKKSLDETRLRKSIRGEIRSILRDLQRSGGRSDSLWMYNGKSTGNSRKGYVNTAFPGPGFR